MAIAVGVMLYFILLMLIASVMSIFEIDGGFISGRPTPLAEAEIASDVLIQMFQLAQEETGVSWAVLAAIAKIESNFGRNMGPSSAGAVGFMQFMPETWSGYLNPYAQNSTALPRWDTNPSRIALYGGYGMDRNGDFIADPFDPADAIATAARYLKANGFVDNPRNALWHYNHSDVYVNDVLRQAEAYSTSMLPSQAGIWPLPSQYTEISSPFGRRVHPTTGEITDHEGIDIPCPEGTSVYAVMDGKVQSAGWMGNAGYAVILQHSNNTQTMYFHFSQVLVITGQSVGQGDAIGLSGNTGRSTGPHLHFGVQINGRYGDPEEWLTTIKENY